jgi:hypothetical protein
VATSVFSDDHVTACDGRMVPSFVAMDALRESDVAETSTVLVGETSVTAAGVVSRTFQSSARPHDSAVKEIDTSR